jgi:hypothetical protein
MTMLLRARSAISITAMALFAVACVTCVTCVTSVRAADDPSSAPAELDPVQTVKAYHAMIMAGDVERAIKQYYHFDQMLADVFEEDYRDLDSAQRRRLRELFYPALEPVMAHPSMLEAMKRSRYGDYASRVRGNGRAVVEFVTVYPGGERRNSWMTLHHFDGQWRILDVGVAGSGGFVGALRAMWKKARLEQTPVAFFEKLHADAQRIMKRAATRPAAK